MPFWFWNDDLSTAEISRQIADFEAHNVFGFVIHPRIGLPREIAWMSETMLDYVEFAVEEAERRNMFVVLYDEGMYPSGSSSGQIVAQNPDLACRALACVEKTGKEELLLGAGHKLLTVEHREDGSYLAIVDRPIDSVIRGLHYIGEGPEEEEPAAANILDPRTTRMFIELVYEKYHRRLKRHFGTTVIGIFTDEPDMLGRLRQHEDLMPGNAAAVAWVSEKLGYDFTPHLPTLWDDARPDAPKYKADYMGAISELLQEVYYRPLSTWCKEHGIALMGHPANPDDIGCQRYFHVPGQDIVWRDIEPGKPSALEGAPSTQAKCTSSASAHLRRRRNSNECYGAYGHELTYEETVWLANWLFVRGVNMLVPHAFYYSMRGPRRDERPPDVGPNSAWWTDYANFATYCARLSWLNTDSHHVCHIAILAESAYLPWRAAKVCFENQMDFNYLEIRDLYENATVDERGIHIADQHYEVLVVDGLQNFPPEVLPLLGQLGRARRLIEWSDQGIPLSGSLPSRNAEDMTSLLRTGTSPDLRLTPPQPDLRYRHVTKDGEDYYFLFNEGQAALEFTIESSLNRELFRLDPWTGKVTMTGKITLEAHQTLLLCSTHP